jgi:hypothetical protein
MMADRLEEPEAIRLVTMMVADKGIAAAERSYLKSLAGFLMTQPRVVAIACCDPNRGLATEVFVRPVIADLARWCARESAPICAALRDDCLQRTFGPPPDAPTNLTAEERAAVAARVREKIKGLKRMDAVDAARAKARGMTEEEAEQARIEEDLMRREIRNAKERDYNERSILGEYAAKGIAPVKDKGGRVLPLSFVRAINPALLVRESATAGEGSASEEGTEPQPCP